MKSKGNISIICLMIVVVIVNLIVVLTNSIVLIINIENSKSVIYSAIQNIILDYEVEKLCIGEYKINLENAKVRVNKLIDLNTKKSKVKCEVINIFQSEEYISVDIEYEYLNIRKTKVKKIVKERYRFELMEI